MNDLLAAVDALTAPIRQRRMQEKDHDHDWLSVKIVRTAAEVRQLTAAEKATARNTGRAPERIEKVIDSGEWWCPWCDERATMPEHDLPKFAVRERVDPSRLAQLESLVASDLGQSGAKKRPAEQSPADVAAIDLAREIRSTVDDWLVKLDHYEANAAYTLEGYVRHWYRLSIARPEVHGRHGTLIGWRQRIDRILTPPRTEEIKGICPRCEFAYVIKDRTVKDGIVTYAGTRSRALQGINGATYADTIVTCQVCGSDWSGREQLLELNNEIDRRHGQKEEAAEPFVA